MQHSPRFGYLGYQVGKLASRVSLHSPRPSVHLGIVLYAPTHYSLSWSLRPLHHHPHESKRYYSSSHQPSPQSQPSQRISTTYSSLFSKSARYPNTAVVPYTIRIEVMYRNMPDQCKNRCGRLGVDQCAMDLWGEDRLCCYGGNGSDLHDG